MTNKLAIIGGSGLYDVEEFKEREIVKGRPAPLTTQEKIDNLKERQEQSRRKAKDAAKERFSKMESRYKEYLKDPSLGVSAEVIKSRFQRTKS